MRSGEFAPFGAKGGDVEADETFIGVDPSARTDVKSLNWVQMNKVPPVGPVNAGRYPASRHSHRPWR